MSSDVGVGGRDGPSGLVARAQVEPTHVDRLHAGQDAALLFSAFPARVTPEYAGRIARVSADAQHDQQFPPTLREASPRCD